MKSQNFSHILTSHAYRIIACVEKTSMDKHAPERATSSLAVKPLFEKEVRRAARFRPGPGMLLPTALKLAVVESLRPNGTAQLCPPS